MKFNQNTLISALSFVAVVMVSFVTFAAEGGAPRPDLSEKVKIAMAIAAGFGIGIAVFGGAIGQAKAIAAALEGIARNQVLSKKCSFLCC